MVTKEARSVDGDRTAHAKEGEKVKKPQKTRAGRPVAGKGFNPFGLFHGVFIPLFLFEDRDIPISAAMLFGWLLYFSGRNGKCFPSQRLLAKKMKLDERSIRRLIRSLEDHHYLRHVRGQKGRSNRYEFVWKSHFSRFLRGECQLKATEAARQKRPPDPDKTVRQDRTPASRGTGQKSPSKRSRSNEIQKETQTKDNRSRSDSIQASERKDPTSTAAERMVLKKHLSSRSTRAAKRSGKIRFDPSDASYRRPSDHSVSSSSAWPDDLLLKDRSGDPSIAAIQDVLNKKCGERLGNSDQQIAVRILNAAHGARLKEILAVLSAYPSDSELNRRPSGRGKPKPRPDSYAFFETHVHRHFEKRAAEYSQPDLKWRSAQWKDNNGDNTPKERVLVVF
jgi:hypothetical protein